MDKQKKLTGISSNKSSIKLKKFQAYSSKAEKWLSIEAKSKSQAIAMNPNLFNFKEVI